jgi:hypothetical protein
MMGYGVTPQTCAVNGIIKLLQRTEWRDHPEGERLRGMLRPLLDSHDDVLRMLSTRAIDLVYGDVSEMIAEVGRRLRTEQEPGVTWALIETLGRWVNVAPETVDTALAGICDLPQWAAIAGQPEDRTHPPQAEHSEIDDLLLQIIVVLSFRRAQPFAVDLTGNWAKSPLRHPRVINRLVAWMRSDVRPPPGWSSDPQTRSFAFLSELADEALEAVATAEQRLSTGSGLDADAQWDLQAAAYILDAVSQMLYFASGAYQDQEQKQLPDERIVDPQFCDLALPLIEKLGRLPAARSAHHLVQTLAFLSRHEPERAFLTIASIVSVKSGYAFESMAEEEVLNLIDLYLAERREVVLGNAECLTALRKTLEAFVAAGSSRAARRVQDLHDLFR